MKVRPNDLEISAGLDPTSVCMGMLGVALAQLGEIDGREETRPDVSGLAVLRSGSAWNERTSRRGGGRRAPALGLEFQ
jgi:hypothetical protein